MGPETIIRPKIDIIRLATMAEDLSGLLHALAAGDQSALDRLAPLVYDELRRLARHYMRGERDGHTLQTTALVNEAYLRLADCDRMQWQDRAHFFGVAAHMMRRILVDYARRRNVKRGAGFHHVSLEEVATLGHRPDPNLIALDDALEAFAKIDARKVRVVELRFFSGLSVEETAEVLAVSPVTVMRDWSSAKAWLFREMTHAASTQS